MIVIVIQRITLHNGPLSPMPNGSAGSSAGRDAATGAGTMELSVNNSYSNSSCRLLLQ